jgi:DNA-binding LacI/PurR family transcriptional regulator
VTAGNRPTIIDVADRAGVSKSLVSLVMRGAPNVSEKRRKAVLKAAAELGYRPNEMARSLVLRRSYVVGVMLSDIQNPFFTDVIDGISAAAKEFDYRALFNTGALSTDGEVTAIETFLQLRVDGLILVGTIVDEATIDQVASDTPLVLASRDSASKLADSVATDDVAGASLAVDHLVGAGHRRIAHVNGGTGAGAAERLLGFVTTMERHGLEGEAMAVDGDYTEAGGIAGMEQILSAGRLPTAVFVANDQAAIGAIRVLTEAGMRIPEDMSVIGYDDTYLAAFEHIDLTSVHQEPVGMGREAVRLLLERTDQGRTEARHVILKPRLTVRGSTAPPSREGSRPPLVGNPTPADA